MPGLSLARRDRERASPDRLSKSRGSCVRQGRRRPLLNAWRSASAMRNHARKIDGPLAGGCAGCRSVHQPARLRMMRSPIAPDRPSNEPLLTRWAWSIFRHSRGFSTTPSCLDLNTCSILGRSFETRNESQGRQSTPPRHPPLSESLTGSVPNRLGTHSLPLPQSLNSEKQLILMDFPRQWAASCGPVTSKAQHRKSHIFSLGAPCLFLKQMFEFQPSV